MTTPKSSSGAESADLAALVERLRDAADYPIAPRYEAANTLESLAAENARLREVLRDIADGNKLPDDLIEHGREHFREHFGAALQHKAREALAPLPAAGQKE